MSILVGATRAVPWGGTLQGEELHEAAGSRDVLIISQDEAIQGEDIVPRRQAELTSDDKRELERLDIPPDQWEDDSSVIAVRMNKDPDYSIIEVIKRKLEEPLLAKYVKKEIEILMNNTQKQGVIVSYFGPGKRNTGDWCFEDGFITFGDVAELYMNHFRGRVLTIDSDCSYAGQWVKQFKAFLDDQEVQPCGHSASDKGILIKVLTSCQSNEVPYRLLYSIRANCNDKNNGRSFVKRSGFEVAHAQHTRFIDSTKIMCKNVSIDELCTLKPGYNWHKDGIKDRIYLVRGKAGGRPAWHYVLVIDDQDTIDNFKEKIASGHVDVADYGQVLKSGWGENPPNNVKEEMENYETS